MTDLRLQVDDPSKKKWGKNDQKVGTSEYDGGGRVAILKKKVYLAIFTVLLQFSCWRNLRATG